MNRHPWLVLAGALLVLPAAPARAQMPAAIDPSGHWEGAVELPSGQIMGFEVDFARNAKAEILGALSIPSQRIKNLPLLSTSVTGSTIAFYAREDQTLGGTLSADGQSIAGEFTMPMGSAPFALTRKGEAKIPPPPSSPAISKELEGTWTVSTGRNGITQRLLLMLANGPDGTATGRLVNLDQGRLQLPLAITQQASTVTLDSVAIAGSFSGAVNADGTELTGTWTEAGKSLPLTFQRSTTAR